MVLLMFWLPACICLRILIKVPSISEIVPGKLYLGNRRAPTCRDPPILLERGITHVLELTDGGSTKVDRSRVPVEHHLQLLATDSLGSRDSLDRALLTEGTRFINQAMEDDKSAILVHCAAGCSRSPAMILYYLVTERKLPMDEAYTLIRRYRPVVDISIDHTMALRRILFDTTAESSKAK